MRPDLVWNNKLALDVRFGYLGEDVGGPRQYNPQVVLNGQGVSVLRAIREELTRCNSFTFSVAFVSAKAIALLKQELLEFKGDGRIVTSDYLSFTSPLAFAELLHLKNRGIDVRIHSAKAFHPKGYIFGYAQGVTAMVGSSNLTANALVTNHEWNLKVSASMGSDLSGQLTNLVEHQVVESAPLTQEWVDRYAESYMPPSPRISVAHGVPPGEPGPIGQIPDDGEVAQVTPSDLTAPEIVPNQMQVEALAALADVRHEGHKRAIIISATGTGKTMLSALDVRAMDPRRMLFVVHREQILDRTIEEYRLVLGGTAADFGKLTGNVKQVNSRYLFATVQTVSQAGVLTSFPADEFDYVIIDEAHRAGSPSHRRVVEYFTPKFLLGMTATPERLDGFNVFELFDYVVPYEIRLNHALETGMVSPFHYYGIADVTFESGATTSDFTSLSQLTSAQRVSHIVRALEDYGQAGVRARGLIFCGGREEARLLSAALNERSIRGRTLRTVALTGADSIEHREAIVQKLEAGELDYVLTVDVFNEGVDIPSVNQVVMLRQTKSAIVFVQQLGRGLRKAKGKEYLVVVDFIGNYANNYLIPIALFGDESLNKESLRKNLIAAEELGVLPGLSSVRFDRISQQRILSSIVETSLDSMSKLKTAMESMRRRVGGVPRLADFLRFESVDPVLLATKRENYPSLIKAVLKVDLGLNADENLALRLLSHEVLPAKRQHEFVLLRALLQEGVLTAHQAADVFADAHLPASTLHVESAVDTFTLERHAEVDQKRYGCGIVVRSDNGGFALTDEFRSFYSGLGSFADAVDDILETGVKLAGAYARDTPFTQGRQYSRKEVMRLLCWPRKWTSTIYGYRTDVETGTCPIFVTLHKSAEVTASTAYEDALLDSSTMLWYTRSKRTLLSNEVRPIVENEVTPYVFVKKDDAEGSDFYFLGRATARNAEQTTMTGGKGEQLDVVRMHLHFDEPIETALYDYFHPGLRKF